MTERTTKKADNKKYLMIGLALLLLILVGMQAVQINGLQDAIETGGTLASPISSRTAPQRSPIPAQTPVMVGGC